MKPTVTLSNTTIAWTERGQGAPVLLLHPLFFDGSIFDSVAGRISQHGYRVVAPDLPDHGESVAHDGRIDPDAMAEAMAEFIVARALERCHVVGVSLGAFVGLRLIARAPGLVRSSVLMAGSAGEEPTWRRRKYILMSWIASILGPGVVARRAARTMLGSTVLNGPRGPMLLSMIESTIRSTRRRAIVGRVRAVVDRSGVSVEERRGILRPVLAVAGAEDRVRTVRETREMVAPIHQHAVVELADCGHLAVLEQPAKTVSLILRFLEADSGP